MTPAGRPTPGYRCSTASLEDGEPMDGTASTVGAFVLVEAPGPWGVDAVWGSRLPAPVKERLAALDARGVRPLLIRRPGRPVPGGVRVFAAWTRGERPWLEQTTLADVEQLVDLPLHEVGAGRSPGLTPSPSPLFLVCTHGRHDPCCAERGRPLAAALAQAASAETWEVSHIGGDRFAGNVMVLPHGLYYGRLEPEDVVPFAAAHRGGRLDLEHLRGRSAYSFPAQAAELHLRRHLGETRIAAVRLTSSRRQGDVTTAAFSAGPDRWEVVVVRHRSGERLLTCRSPAPSTAPRHEVVSLTRLPRQAP